jgi:hypothetical protein
MISRGGVPSLACPVPASLSFPGQRDDQGKASEMTTKPAPKPDNDTPADGGEQEAEQGSTTVTVNDHEYVVTDTARDDFELMDDIEEMIRTGDGGRTPAIMRRILGRQQMAAALERLRDEETGRVPIDAGTGFVMDLLKALNPN